MARSSTRGRRRDGRQLTMDNTDLADLLSRVADRDRPRAEATVQADVRQVLLVGGFGLDVNLEAQVVGGRIDVEAGATVIEVKKDLRPARILRSGLDQLAGYVLAR